MEYFNPDETIISHSRMLFDSFYRHTGTNLVEPSFASDAELANRLYRAPFVLLSHDAQDDPVFNYANETAQVLWGMTWDEFVQLASKFSAEPQKMEERKIALENALRKGYISNYESVRISRSGRRFLIKNATLWNVEDDDGVLFGQAAMFNNWQFI